MHSVALILLALAIGSFAATCVFDYDNPDVLWPEIVSTDCPQTCDRNIYHQQSPVAIITESVDPTLNSIPWNYTTADLVTNIAYEGYTVLTNLTGLGNIGTYQTLQMHFHTPAENLPLGRSKLNDMELHIVHKDYATGKLLVVAFFIDIGAVGENPVWLDEVSLVADNMTKLNLTKVSALNTTNNETTPVQEFEITIRGLMQTLNDLKAAKKDSYWTFPGSLTTPPCSEIVTWYVMKEPLTVPQNIFTLLDEGVANNSSRDVQRNLTDVPRFDPNYQAATPSTGAEALALSFVASFITSALAAFISARE